MIAVLLKTLRGGNVARLEKVGGAQLNTFHRLGFPLCRFGRLALAGHCISAYCRSCLLVCTWWLSLCCWCLWLILSGEGARSVKGLFCRSFPALHKIHYRAFMGSGSVWVDAVAASRPYETEIPLICDSFALDGWCGRREAVDTPGLRMVVTFETRQA